jgi:hypothetical protein
MDAKKLRPLQLPVNFDKNSRTCTDMGNSNSSRWREHERRLNVHEAVKLEARRVAEVANAGTVPGAWDLAYAASLPWGPVRDRVELVTVRKQFGGVQPFLRCVGCGMNRRTLYVSPGAHVVRCRKCLRLSYRSQRLAPCDRLFHRALTLARRLGECTVDELLATGCPEKPKRMHWRSYDRRARAVRALLRAREDDVHVRYARYFDRISGRIRKKRVL